MDEKDTPTRRIARPIVKRDYLALVYQEEQELRQAIINSLKECNNGHSSCTAKRSKLATFEKCSSTSIGSSTSKASSKFARPNSLALFSVDNNNCISPCGAKLHARSSLTNTPISQQLKKRLFTPTALTPTKTPRAKSAGLKLKSPVARVTKEQLADNVKASKPDFLAPIARSKTPGLPVKQLKSTGAIGLNGSCQGITQTFSDPEDDIYSLFNSPSSAAAISSRRSSNTSSSSVPDESIDFQPRTTNAALGEVVTVLNMANDAVPPQLWQDFNGRPANVHDFVNFLASSIVWSSSDKSNCEMGKANWFTVAPQLRPIRISKASSNSTIKHLCNLGSSASLFKPSAAAIAQEFTVSSIKNKLNNNGNNSSASERLLELIENVKLMHPRTSCIINDHGHGTVKVNSVTVAKKHASYVYQGNHLVMLKGNLLIDQTSEKLQQQKNSDELSMPSCFKPARKLSMNTMCQSHDSSPVTIKMGNSSRRGLRKTTMGTKMTTMMNSPKKNAWKISVDECLFLMPPPPRPPTKKVGVCAARKKATKSVEFANKPPTIIKPPHRQRSLWIEKIKTGSEPNKSTTKCRMARNSKIRGVVTRSCLQLRNYFSPSF